MQNIVVESITPAKAKELLATMVRNREMSQARVIEYAIAMDEGRWSLNGETLKIDKDGKLFDGQNRLNACILAGKAFRTYVVRGIDDPEAFATVDVGKTRNASDIFGMAGYASAAATSGAATVIYALKTCTMSWSGPLERRTRLAKTALGRKLIGGGTGKVNMVTPGKRMNGFGGWFSRHELLEFAGTIKEDLDSAVRFGHASKARKLIGISVLAGLYYLFHEKNAIEAHSFFEQLGEGAGLASTDPVLHLRNRMVEYRGNRGHAGVKMSRWYWVGLSIKAWNKRRSDQVVRNLFVASGEPFPTKIE